MTSFASRRLLHKDKVGAFRAWLAAQNIPCRDGRGDFEVLQVQRKDGQWFKLYSRLKMPEHVTVQGPLVQLVRRFIRDSHHGVLPMTAEGLGTCHITTDEPLGSDPSLYEVPPWD